MKQNEPIAAVKRDHVVVDEVKVTTPIDGKLTTVESPLSTPAVCSLSFLRRYATSKHSYPTIPFEAVNFNLSDDSKVQQLAVSKSCWFPPSQINKGQLSAVLTKKNIQRILILGDSNGQKYFDATLRLLQGEGRGAAWSCAVVKSERNRPTKHPDELYFIRQPNLKLGHIQVRFRECPLCLSTLTLCNYTTSSLGLGDNKETNLVQQVRIEYIVLEFAMDASLTTHRTYWSGYCEHGHMCEHSTSTQEFIFKEYLHEQYPDVVFYFASRHDFVRHKMRQLRQNFELLFEIMSTYLPPTTTVIFMNVHKLLTSVMSPTWREGRYDNGMLNCNEAIERQNSIVYQSLDKYLVSSNVQWFAFPSLFDSSNTTDNLYATDGIHRTDEWYDYIVRDLFYLLST